MNKSMEPESGRLVPITLEPFNAETPLKALSVGLTPAELVYVRNHFEVPQFETRNWSLEVTGSVERPMALSYDELRSFPSQSLTMVLECAGNGRKVMHPVPAGTPWSYGAVSVIQLDGTPLSNLLQAAGVTEGAIEAVFEGADRGEVEPGRVVRFARSLPMKVALNPDVLLAWQMNGEPLSAEHGFPARLVVPGWYGMASVKWLRRITLTSEPFDGFFQTEHYVYEDEVGTPQAEPVRHQRPRSLILDPSEGTRLRTDRAAEVSGMAWSGFGPVETVEFSPDGVVWATAELEPQHDQYGVQRWTHRWTPETKGQITLRSRATDTTGNAQPTEQRWNRLGYGNNGPHLVSVFVE